MTALTCPNCGAIVDCPAPWGDIDLSFLWASDPIILPEYDPAALDIEPADLDALLRALADVAL